MLVLYQGKYRADKKIYFEEIGLKASDELYVRDLWAHTTSGPHAGSVSVSVGPDDVAFLRLSKKNDFPIPPVLVADTYRHLSPDHGRAARDADGDGHGHEQGELGPPAVARRCEIPALVAHRRDNGRRQEPDFRQYGHDGRPEERARTTPSSGPTTSIPSREDR